MKKLFSFKRKTSFILASNPPEGTRRTFYSKQLAALGLAINSTIAFATIPGFTGILGVAKAGLVGLGMLAGSALALPAAAIGMVVGGTLGFIVPKSGKAVVNGAIIGAAAFGLAGGVAGSVWSYQGLRKALTEQSAKAAFNTSSPKTDAKKTVILAPSAFQKCRIF